MILKQKFKCLALAAGLALGSGWCFGAETPRTAAFPPAFEDPEDVPLPDPDLWHRIRMGFALEPLETASAPLVARVGKPELQRAGT